MLPGLCVRGWIVMCFISILLFTAVAAPAAYISKTRWRTIYVAVATPVVWVIYNAVLYLILYRPMVRCASMLRCGAFCKTKHADGTSNVKLFTKEMYQLNNALHALKCETAEIRAATTLINQQLDGHMGDGSHHEVNSPITVLTPAMYLQ
ncbi:conserved hypothetical protein [Leishmania braziliensis MHOM/BR/75/M2904]|uniref:Uncharacterized protein n=1 Tax=Leishmania braziliensis TaxID=5660 RepID=A4HMK5_LEIBR|nr:conserved hypothetical protein [Leishmania braziliensis MHOM/BR/75/M2904]KAI5689254.1 hypothetical protein MNV84_07401 [Leishmania braziliensis]CAJ2480238.1 unnamed protein product [Leishmania braziliensis]CAJ2480642.1 unnamed protein product [Leishmania braziliensis]CAM43392.1 conserved hypothetical protein [Leishmania braziliensis MHOM/BR/75/M2904]